jgi:hypothetical protein
VGRSHFRTGLPLWVPSRSGGSFCRKQLKDKVFMTPRRLLRPVDGRNGFRPVGGRGSGWAAYSPRGTVHELRATTIQMRVEPRRHFVSASVDQSAARNAKRRIALGVSDRRWLRESAWLLRSIISEQEILWPGT